MPDRPEPVDSALPRTGDTGPLRAPVPPPVEAASPLGQGLPPAGGRVGPYRLEAEVGRGGMGAVYRAVRDDDAYHKQVAVKLLRGGLWSADLLARFRSERQILARLEHPSIARLIDGGTNAAGVPYLVLEYVDGRPVTAFCDERRLAVRERLRLFAEVCDAVQYAHQNLVVHRDLKPSNILVTADGRPRLLDFGIAKLLDAGSEHDATVARTGTHVRLMTPEYASPEQARGDAVTTASDLYSLGVLLYELLTGQRPLTFEATSATEIERRLREEEPPRPSTAVARRTTLAAIRTTAGARAVSEAVAGSRGTRPAHLRKLLAGDLDTIVLKALQKEPARRYASAQALADDVRRFLDGLPVLARPDSIRYRAGKFVRRHRAAVAAASAFVALAVASALVLSVQAVRLARERNKALAAEREARQVATFLTDIFQVPDPGVSRGSTVTAREILDSGAARIRSQLQDQPLVEAALLQTIGNTYRRLGLQREALPLLDEALALRRRVLGEEHADTATSLNDAAEVRRELSDYAAAEPLYRRALEVRTRLLGPEHERTGESVNNLALLLLDQGETPEAEALLRRALDIRRRALGARHPQVAITLSNLALAVRARGGLDEAERLNREVLALRREMLGPDHPQVAHSIANLASTLDARGKDAEAEALFREALALRERLLGPEHPDTAVTLSNLASVLQDEGRLDEAERLYRRALEVRRRVLPAGHIDVAVTLNNLASLLEDRGRLEEAEPLFRDSLAIRLARLGEDSPVVARARHNLGRVLAARGRLREGEALLRSALETRRRRLGAAHPDVAISLAALASVARDRRDLEGAERLYREALALRRASFAAGHPDVSDTLSALSLVLVERGRAREAEALASEAASGDGPDDGPVRARARIALGAAQCATGRLAEGAALIRRGRDALASRLGRDNRGVREADRWLRRFASPHATRVPE